MTTSELVYWSHAAQQVLTELQARIDDLPEDAVSLNAAELQFLIDEHERILRSTVTWQSIRAEQLQEELHLDFGSTDHER